MEIGTGMEMAWKRGEGIGEGMERTGKQVGMGLTEEDARDDDDFFLETGLEVLVLVDVYSYKRAYIP